MFCTNCGKSIPDVAKFCPDCGTPVVIRPKPTEPKPQEPTPAPAPQPVYTQAPPPVYTQPQTPPPAYTPAQAAVPPQEQPVQEKAKTVRDGRGKYIIKRLIFCAVAVTLGILVSILFANAGIGKKGAARPVNQLFPRLLATIVMILVPLAISFVISMLTGLVRSKAGRNVFRVISVILRSLAPFAFGLFLVDLLGIKLKLLPISMMANNAAAWVLPLLALTLPLTGFLMNAAVTNGHPSRFGASAGAVAGWAADRMPVIVAASIAVESIFASRGLGRLLLQSIMQIDFKTAASVLIIYVVLVYGLKLLMDVIAALASGGDPAEQVYAAREKTDHSGNVLFIIGVVCAATVILAAFILPFIAPDPSKISAKAVLLPPGTDGHLLGTDQLGRDIFSMCTYGIRNTVIMALTNTMVAAVLGIAFGVLSGFLRGFPSELFKCIRYVFGFGTAFALILLFFLGKGGMRSAAVFCVFGLFGWGGIAERLNYGIKAHKNAAPQKTALILPVLGQVVHTFAAAIFAVSCISFMGLTILNPAFPLIGSSISSGWVSIGMRSFAGLWPAAFLIVLLLAVFLLHAGLAAKERYLETEDRQ